MTSRNFQAVRFIALGLLAAPLVTIGCKKKEPPPPPPPPPPSGPVTVMPSMVAESMALSSSVILGALPETECSEEQVRAMLSFADDFATGDQDALLSKMQGTAHGVLTSMVEDGSWNHVTSDLQNVTVTMMEKAENQCVFSFDVVTPQGRDPLTWVLQPRGDMYTFDTLYIPPVIDVEAMMKEALEAAGLDESALENLGEDIPDNRDRNRDPRRRVPQTPPGKGPSGPN